MWIRKLKVNAILTFLKIKIAVTTLNISFSSLKQINLSAFLRQSQEFKSMRNFSNSSETTTNTQVMIKLKMNNNFNLMILP